MDDTTKQCKDCSIILPLSAFYKHKGMNDGRRPECRECSAKRAGREYTKPKNKIDKNGYKICSKCSLNKHKSEYPKDSQYTNGIRPECSVCHKSKYEQYKTTDGYKQSRERESLKRQSPEYKSKRRQYNKQYYISNQPKLVKESRLRYWINVDSIREKDRLRNKDPKRRQEKRRLGRVRYSIKRNEILAKDRAYKQTERGRKLKYANNRNRRALQSNADGHHTHEDIQAIIESQDYLCAYCGDDLKESGYHVDHIFPLSRGGTNSPENLCCACPSCNCSKQDLTIDEWRNRGNF